MTELLSEHTALLEQLRESVINKPELKGLAKSNYRERMHRFEESYKTLRKSAGEYQKQAFGFLTKITRLEQDMSTEFHSATSEVETLRSSCESFEAEMTESHKQLTILRTERTALEKTGKKLEETLQSLNGRVKTLEQESVQQASTKASLEVQLKNYEGRTKEQEDKLTQMTSTHKMEMDKVSSDLMEKHEMKMSGMTEKMGHLTTTLESIRQDLLTSSTKVTAMETRVEEMTKEREEMKSKLEKNAEIMQKNALTEVKQSAELEHLRSSLESKNKEMERALDGLKHTQTMSEKRADELSVEKNDMR